MQRFAFSTMRPAVSRKQHSFPVSFGPGGTVLPPRVLPFQRESALSSMPFDDAARRRLAPAEVFPQDPCGRQRSSLRILSPRRASRHPRSACCKASLPEKPAKSFRNTRPGPSRQRKAGRVCASTSRTAQRHGLLKKQTGPGRGPPVKGMAMLPRPCPELPVPARFQTCSLSATACGT